MVPFVRYGRKAPLTEAGQSEGDVLQIFCCPTPTFISLKETICRTTTSYKPPPFGVACYQSAPFTMTPSLPNQSPHSPVDSLKVPLAVQKSSMAACVGSTIAPVCVSSISPGPISVPLQLMMLL